MSMRWWRGPCSSWRTRNGRPGCDARTTRGPGGCPYRPAAAPGATPERGWVVAGGIGARGTGEGVALRSGDRPLGRSGADARGGSWTHGRGCRRLLLPRRGGRTAPRQQWPRPVIPVARACPPILPVPARISRHGGMPIIDWAAGRGSGSLWWRGQFRVAGCTHPDRRPDRRSARTCGGAPCSPRSPEPAPGWPPSYPRRPGPRPPSAHGGPTVPRPARRARSAGPPLGSGWSSSGASTSRCICARDTRRCPDPRSGSPTPPRHPARDALAGTIEEVRRVVGWDRRCVVPQPGRASPPAVAASRARAPEARRLSRYGPFAGPRCTARHPSAGPSAETAGIV